MRQVYLVPLSFIFFCDENDPDERLCLYAPEFLVSCTMIDSDPHRIVQPRASSSIQRQLSTHFEPRTRPILGVDDRPTAVGCDPAGISRRVHSAQDSRAPGKLNKSIYWSNQNGRRNDDRPLLDGAACIDPMQQCDICSSSLPWTPLNTFF